MTMVTTVTMMTMMTMMLMLMMIYMAEVLLSFVSFFEVSRPKTRGVEMYHTVEWPLRGWLTTCVLCKTSVEICREHPVWFVMTIMMTTMTTMMMMMQ